MKNYSIQKLGSYIPIGAGKRMTYTYESTVAGWFIYEQEHGKEKVICRIDEAIRELLTHIDYLETRAWEEAAGENL